MKKNKVMKAIEEGYVSFETAKLLKEKGFDEYCPESYFKMDKTLKKSGFSEWEKVNEIKAPTQSLAMKWLREVHKLVICAEIGNENDKGNTDYSNPDRWYWFFDITNEKGVVIDTESDYVLNEYSSYEQACEAAIKYCLEHLI